MKHIKNAKVTAKIQIREGAQIRVLGGTGTGTRTVRLRLSQVRSRNIDRY